MDERAKHMMDNSYELAKCRHKLDVAIEGLKRIDRYQGVSNKRTLQVVKGLAEQTLKTIQADE